MTEHVLSCFDTFVLQFETEGSVEPQTHVCSWLINCVCIDIQLNPWWPHGRVTMYTEINVSSAESPNLSCALSFKPGVGQNIASHALPTARKSDSHFCFSESLSFFVSSPHPPPIPTLPQKVFKYEVSCTLNCSFGIWQLLFCLMSQSAGRYLSSNLETNPRWKSASWNQWGSNSSPLWFFFFWNCLQNSSDNNYL